LFLREPQISQFTLCVSGVGDLPLQVIPAGQASLTAGLSRSSNCLLAKASNAKGETQIYAVYLDEHGMHI
jgi:hypothetical protein